MLKAGDPAVVREHPDWLRTSNEYIRQECIMLLAGKGDKRDLGAVRHALADGHENTGWFARRGLERIQGRGSH